MMEKRKDLSKFSVLSNQNISKRLFYSEPHENQRGKFSLSLIKLKPDVDYVLRNLLLSKIADQSYYPKFDGVTFIDRSLSIDLSKYNKISDDQNIEIAVDVGSSGHDTTEQATTLANDVGGLLFGGYFDPEGGLPDNANVGSVMAAINTIVRTESHYGGMLEGVLRGAGTESIETGSSFIINYLFKFLFNKYPADTYLGVRIYSVNKSFLLDAFSEINSPFKIYKDGTELDIDSRSDLSQVDVSLLAGYADHKSRFQIELTSQDDLDRFEKFRLLGTFSTIDNSQMNISIPFQTRDDFLLIVPFATARRFSSYVGSSIMEEIQNFIWDIPGEDLADKQQRLINGFSDSKSAFTAKLQEILQKIQNDEPLENVMKVAKIEGIINFNLEEVQYAS